MRRTAKIADEAIAVGMINMLINKASSVAHHCKLELRCCIANKCQFMINLFYDKTNLQVAKVTQTSFMVKYHKSFKL